jgi:PAS domain S-box-containing protein
MRLRTILLILSLLTFFSASAAGYLYYSHSRQWALREAERDAISGAEDIRERIGSHLTAHLKSARALAGLQDMRSLLIQPGEDHLRRANATLDHFCRALSVDVCYLMDRNGNTIASSNRNDPDSFMGENYAFRPYFQEAIEGTPAVYMARGITSRKRGVYYSHAIHGKDLGDPLGVVVIKASMDLIEKEFLGGLEGIVALVDPGGLVFVSNRSNWLFHFLWKPSPVDIESVIHSRQFGEGPFTWVGFERTGDRQVRDASGNEYTYHAAVLDNYPGWAVVHLQSTQAVSRKVPIRFLRTLGFVTLMLCALMGLLVFFLYRKASYHISQRKAAEAALIQSEETALALLNAPTEGALLLDTEGVILALNRTAADRFGKTPEQIIGRCAFDLFQPDIATKRRAHHEEAVRTGKPVRYEDQRDGRWLNNNLYPVFDSTGRVVRVAVFSSDVTDQKQADEALQLAKEELTRYSRELEVRVGERTQELLRLSANIMTTQEKERTAIARELHDELGQMLTALRFESVWITDHLRETDPGASERARVMCDLIDKTIDEVRGMSIRLRPGVLDDLGLLAALEWYALDFEKRTSIECSFQHDRVERLSDVLSTAAYRIAQEALTNVARHSGASHAKVVLERWDGVLTLSVRDNGKGFDTAALANSDCLGMAGMRERAGLVGGSLDIRSRRGGGTEIVFQVPMPHEKEGIH